MPQPLLNANNDQEYVDDRDERIGDLLEENHNLRRDLSLAQTELAQAKRQNARGVAGLRKILLPWYHAIGQILGEMTEIDGGDSAGAEAANPKWESFKKRMPGRPAEFIDLLLVHGAMNVTQFMTLAKCGKNTVYQVVSKLGQAGVIVNNGGRYSLKD